MTTPRSIVIVGGGLAGAKAAEALRNEGYEGRVVLVGQEPRRPYERPPLSKDYLRGEAELESAYVHAQGFYDDQSIELRTGVEVTAIDRGAKEVVLDGGERIGWDCILIATGAEPRRLALPGADLDGVMYLRSVEDSDRLKEAIAKGGRLVVVGAGWIGSEAAASARQGGMEVTVLERLGVPLENVLGPTLGAVYADIHRDHGVELLAGVELESLEGGARVERVRLGDGRTIDCDAVLVGVGVAPRTGLAEAAGLEVDNGILVDGMLRARARRLRRRRRGQRPAPLLRPQGARGALGQRPQSGARGGAQHARARGALRPHPLLLLGPVRRGHGVLGPGERHGRGRGAGRSRRA